MSRARVNIKPLKDFAFNCLPKGALRTLLISEENELDVSVFLARLPYWLKLSRFLKGED
jgi:hypothetical protein